MCVIYNFKREQFKNRFSKNMFLKTTALHGLWRLLASVLQAAPVRRRGFCGFHYFVAPQQWDLKTSKQFKKKSSYRLAMQQLPTNAPENATRSAPLHIASEIPRLMSNRISAAILSHAIFAQPKEVSSEACICHAFINKVSEQTTNKPELAERRFTCFYFTFIPSPWAAFAAFATWILQFRPQLRFVFQRCMCFWACTIKRCQTTLGATQPGFRTQESKILNRLITRETRHKFEIALPPGQPRNQPPAMKKLTWRPGCHGNDRQTSMAACWEGSRI